MLATKDHEAEFSVVYLEVTLPPGSDAFEEGLDIAFEVR